MKYYSAKVSFTNPVLAGAVFAIMFSVTIMLWYQSSRKNRGTRNNTSILIENISVDKLAMFALSKDGCKNDVYLLKYIKHLKENGYHKSALIWLKSGAERGVSVDVMREYSSALSSIDPEKSMVWLKRADEQAKKHGLK